MGKRTRYIGLVSRNCSQDAELDETLETINTCKLIEGTKSYTRLTPFQARNFSGARACART
jgi:hypothetical protein